MSGIAGIYHGDGAPADLKVLETMLARIAHRGPDREGKWADGQVALGHRLLFTTTESLRERQPVTDPDGRWTLVWDGRLDNREELIGVLAREDLPLGSKTDPELVLGAYRRWGERCPQNLLGDYAFAVWDEEARSLFCVRDRLGLKPFHYTWDGKTFLFASESGPLWAALGTSPEPDDEMVLAFLLREFRESDAERTLFRGIRRLPPGHSLHLRDGRMRVSRYWNIDPAMETRYAREHEYADHFRCLFQEAVRCRLRSFFPIGALVSGGLDSSAIVCTAEKLCAASDDAIPPIEAFTLFGEGEHADERPYFQEVIKATGLKGHSVSAKPEEDPLNGLDDLIRRVGSPIIGMGYQGGSDLMAALGSRGCRVVLSGDGGDQLLDGLGSLSDLLTGLHLKRFLRETRAMALWYGAGPREFARVALAAALPPALKYLAKRLLRGVPPGWMNPETARSVRLRERIGSPRLAMRFPSVCQADTYLNVTGPYYGLKLEVDERDAAARGMEMRYPFLDSRLVEFVLSIPSDSRMWSGVWKGLLRAAMRGVVPETIRLRKGKGDWTEPADRALTALCRRKEPAPLANRSARMQRYVDLGGARAFMRRYLAGDRDLRYDIWFLLTLDHWLAWLGERDHHG